MFIIFNDSAISILLKVGVHVFVMYIYVFIIVSFLLICVAYLANVKTSLKYLHKKCI